MREAFDFLAFKSGVAAGGALGAVAKVSEGFGASGAFAPADSSSGLDAGSWVAWFMTHLLQIIFGFGE